MNVAGPVLAHVMELVKKIALPIKLICQNKMFIDWESLNKKDFPIDYYGITLKDGAVVKNRIYYLTDGSAVTSIDPCFNNLALRHFLECFSLGKENDNNLIKYDFKVNKEHWKNIIKIISNSFRFCSKKTLQTVLSVLSVFEKEFYLRVLGMTFNKQTSNTENICFYFYSHERIDIATNFNIINKLCSFFLKEKTKEKIYWPFCNEFGYLCFIAVDFFANAPNKIKFYFEFLHGYERSLFLAPFIKTNMFTKVFDLINSNARIDMLQIAISENGKISYNFYLQEEKE